MGNRGRIALGILLALGLFWLNAYIGRDLFISGHTGKTNSMHGYWTAMARHATLRHWFWPTWWPYWDAGMPFEWTYAPLVPALTALKARYSSIDPSFAFGWVSGLFYSLTPVTLFACAAVLTRRILTSFAAGALYSLTAPTQLLMPDEPWKLARFGDARRLYLVGAWDETPHVAALTFLPLVVLFTVLALKENRARWWLLAALSMAASVAANAFGATGVFFTLCCVLFAWAAASPITSTLRVGAAGILGWFLIAGWLPLSELGSMRAAAQLHDHGWTVGSWTALALVLCAVTAAWTYCSRRPLSPWARFLILFATLMTSIPAVYEWTAREFLPQSGRYKMESEMALALALAFGGAELLRRVPSPLRVALCAVLLAFAVEQTVSHRKYEKQLIHSADMGQTLEGKVAAFFQEHMPSSRVAAPGSIAQWLNNFGPQPQFSGSSWSTAYNLDQQRLNAAWHGAQTPAEAQQALGSLRRFGVEALVVTGKSSAEFWKAVAHPEVYSPCEAMWSQQDTTICRIRHQGDPMVHSRGSFRWLGLNEAAVSVAGPTSVSVTWHPGWRAFTRSGDVPVVRDHLGLMRLEPRETGPVDIRLVYNGGLELQATRVLMYLAWSGVAAFIVKKALAKARRASSGI